jgi:hypothetical protein
MLSLKYKQHIFYSTFYLFYPSRRQRSPPRLLNAAAQSGFSIPLCKAMLIG